MVVLGFETVTEIGSVALVENGVLVGEVRLNRRFALSRNLLQSIDFLLRSLDIDSQKLEGIAVSIGPGSYTGQRIGLSVAKGLAYIWDLPIVAVNSLDALAEEGCTTKELICPLIRFRKREYYYAFYTMNDGSCSRESEYGVGKLEEIVEAAGECALYLGVIHPEDRATLNLLEEKGKARYDMNRAPSAFWVALKGEQMLRRGISEDVARISPYYMHDFPIRMG